MKLDLNDFDPTESGYRLEPACGLTVALRYDQFAENPFAVWDGEPPIVWRRDRDLTADYSRGCERFFDYVSDTWTSRHWRAICAILDVDPATHDSATDDTMAGWTRGTRGEARREAFACDLETLQLGGPYYVSTDPFLVVLAQLYDLAKIPALHFTRRGYSQGDVIGGLAVLLPDWCAEVRYKPDGGDSDARQMEAAADLLAAWAFGDVYGFAIGDDSDDYLDSCWGFYGDPEDSGVLNDAANALRGCLGVRLAHVGAELATAARFAAGPYYPAA